MAVLMGEGGLVELLGPVGLGLHAGLAALHHVDEVGERLLLVHRDVSEVAAHRLEHSGDSMELAPTVNTDG